LKAKGDAQGYRIVSSIVGTIFKGAKLKKAKDKKTLVLDISNAKFDSEAMIRFEDAVTKKLSIRGALAGHIKGEIKPKKKIELPKASKAYVERMIKEGYNIDAIVASIQALR
jgi:Zn-dependent alcohol dehydrogenase